MRSSAPRQPFVERLLEVLDDFDLALMSAERRSRTSTGSCSGVELVYAKLADTLRAEGLERIERRASRSTPSSTRR